MRKITHILCVSCLLVLCNTVLADKSDTKQKKSNKTKSSETKQTHAKPQKSTKSKQISAKTTQSSKPNNTTPAQSTVAAKTTPAATLPASAPTAQSEQTVAPASTTPAPAAELKPTVVSQPAPPVAPPLIDCFYQIASNPISDIELSLWAQYAALKSFDYSFDKMDTQLQGLKSCFTEQGWTGFNEALKQSGNLTTIKTQQLTVSSQIAGKPEVNLIKANQWRITVPLDVVYQNTQEKLTQSLAVVLVVTKKTATELGIVQLIAAPKPEKVAEQVATKS